MTVQELNILVGQNIKHYRKLKGLKQYELAKLIGTSDKIVSFHETGRHFPNLKDLVIYVDKLGIEINQLFEKKTENKKVLIRTKRG